MAHLCLIIKLYIYIYIFIAQSNILPIGTISITVFLPNPFSQLVPRADCDHRKWYFTNCRFRVFDKHYSRIINPNVYHKRQGEKRCRQPENKGQ